MVAALLLCTSMLVPTLRAQGGAAAPEIPAPERLNAVWTINKDLSTTPAAMPGDRAGGAGGDRSGGSNRGSFGGGRGARGGRGAGGSSVADARKAMALMRELGQAPDSLTIVSHDDQVSITDSDGVTRKFAASGKVEKIAIGGETVDVKSRWNDEVFAQEFKVGSVVLVRMIETTTDGHQLVMTIKPKNDHDRDAGQIQRFVYDTRPIGSAPPSR